MNRFAKVYEMENKNTIYCIHFASFSAVTKLVSLTEPWHQTSLLLHSVTRPGDPW